MEYRKEHDSLGEVDVPADKLWGAQTQRSVEHFQIGVGQETMPREILTAFSFLKEAAALVNHALLPEKMTEEKLHAIVLGCEAMRSGTLDDQFPLVVWQTGSGTHTNMNVNEVLSNYGNKLSPSAHLHPNDDVNMSQSSNDTFPTAMHVAAVFSLQKVLDSGEQLVRELAALEEKNSGVLKCGRTHLQDATPILFSQEISGWRSSIEKDLSLIRLSVSPLEEIALGGTAVGTGLNAPKGFDVLVAEKIAQLTGFPFVSAPNKFHALTSLDEMVHSHGALKALACDLMKIANDIRWLASGPRLGLGEIRIPANEPGSSIMPGKVNPTQCEAVTMVAAQILGNDATLSFAASQGNFELNVFLPVTAYNFLQSARLLTEAMTSFRKNCVCGITANREKMAENVSSSLLLATALNPHIGYENAAKVVKYAYENNTTLKKACADLGLLNESEYDRLVHPESMV